MKHSMSSAFKLYKISEYKKQTSVLEDQIKASKFQVNTI